MIDSLNRLGKNFGNLLDYRDLGSVVRNACWLSIDRVFRMLVGLVVGFWIARYLGPSQFGLWNYAIAFSSFFAIFASMGLDSTVVKDLIQHPDLKDKLLGSVFALKILGGTSAFLISIFLILLIHNGDILLGWLVGLTSTTYIFQASNVIDFYFQSKLVSKYTVLANNIAFFIATILKLILLVCKASLIAFACVSLSEFILTSFFVIYIYKSKFSSLRNWCFDPKIAVSLLKSCWPLILSGLSIMIYMRIDQIMIGRMLGDADLGKFSAAVRLSEVWYFLPFAFVTSFASRLFELKSKNQMLYRNSIQNLMSFMVLISFFVALLISHFSEWLVLKTYGDAYSGTAAVLRVHVWGGVFVFLGVISEHWLVAENLQRLAFYRTFFGALLNVVANLILIPKMGIVGAAYATLVTQILVTYLYDLTNCRLREIFAIKTKALLLIEPVRKIFI